MSTAPTPVFKLGCLPPKPAQQANLLRLSNYVDLAKLPPPPHTVDYGKPVSDWGMMANDRLGCCTIATNAHSLMCWSANAGNTTTVTEADVVATYNRLTGGQDTGLVVLDELNDWRSTPFAGNTLGAYAAVKPSHTEMVMQALYLFGVLSCGANLPVAWQGAKKWDVDPNGSTDGDWEPGGWGGHSVPIISYDQDNVYVVTWGAVMPVTWAAFKVYFSEVYALLDNLWFTSVKKAPNGFNITSLTADLKAVTA